MKSFCKNCKHLIQHFGICNDFGLFKVECGHCAIRGCRTTYIKECDKFEEIEQTDFKIVYYNVYDMMHRASIICSKLYDEISEIRKKFFGKEKN